MENIPDGDWLVYIVHVSREGLLCSVDINFSLD